MTTFMKIVKNSRDLFWHLPFDRTFDFNLCAKKHRRRPANFKRDFIFLRIMLYVCGITRCNWWMIIFGCTWLCIAWFLTCRPHTRTQFIATFNFMLLCHNLFAFNFSLFYTSTAWSAKMHGFFLNFFLQEKLKHWFDTYFEHFDHADTSQRTGQSKILQYWRCAGGGWGHIESGTTIVFSPPRVTSWIHWTYKNGEKKLLIFTWKPRRNN